MFFRRSFFFIFYYYCDYFPIFFLQRVRPRPRGVHLLPHLRQLPRLGPPLGLGGNLAAGGAGGRLCLLLDTQGGARWDPVHYFNFCTLFEFEISLGAEIHLLWAGHQVHHSSEEYNLTTALRQSVFQLFGAIVSHAFLQICHVVDAASSSLHERQPRLPSV